MDRARRILLATVHSGDMLVEVPILFENEHFLVVSKPAGTFVHQSQLSLRK